MARKVIDVGAIGNDGTGDSIRDSFTKVNDNFRELYSSLGLGEKLTFIGLDDTPASFIGQENAVLTVNQTTDGVKFKQITAGTGMIVDNTSNANQIILSTEFSEISGDTSPQLGGNLSVKSGGNTYKIVDLALPTEPTEATSKTYVDTKISKAGVNAVDPETGTTNPSFGFMSGPLILSRDPEPDDDEVYGGLIAATKNYVDGSAFGSAVNLYVATSGEDERPGISSALQGRALAYAYRSIEAALKKAEEILLESNDDIGPYKKVLTYDDGAKTVTLDAIDTSPSSGSGFVGSARLSVDTITINTQGVNYRVGDIVTLAGGTGDKAYVEVLSTSTNPGPIVTFRLLSSGNYTAIPGSTAVSTTTDSAFGAGAKFDVAYKVNNITISAGGSGYSLVSVRVTGGGGTGAFGVATVTGGVITAIEITDGGSGFTSLPSVTVDLPRLLLKTEGLRTDFTGDVTTDTAEAIRGRDIREGLYLRGETSGALAQILAHEGALDSEGREIFDVDVKYGTFQIGEPMAYGDITNQTQISVLIESGIYEENYPLKIPQNVAIIGDEFRRVLIKPKQGTSSSPWAFQRFRRDTTIDGLTTATQLFGYHYLEDSTEPVYPKINNGGGRKGAAQLILLNKGFLQNEMIAWINYQIANNIAPFTSTFTYNQALCKRDYGLILDAMIFDLKWGEYNRTISAGLKYYESASARIAITTQLSESIAGLNYLETLLEKVVGNTEITTVYNSVLPQIIDFAYVAESGTVSVLGDLFDALVDVIDGSGSVNYPKDNDKLDVFLCNDANIIRAVTMQGHGGFALVLDPTGQILAKSPYCQESASFSKSINAQTFAGGMFVDGFSGNLQFKHVSSTSDTRINVSGLDRFPQLPASFIVGDRVYRINYVRDYVYDPAGSTATLILDETNPFTVSPGSQTITSVTVGNPGIITRSDHRLEAGATLVFTTTGTLPGGITAGREYYVSRTGLTNNTFRISTTFDGNSLVEITSGGSGTHSYQRIYEILMPGNRSMLSNDFTQVADMGYGLLATNGGLTEAVSMFTYYCYASYMSLNGAQIRSVAGSSAHGIYALVAEGSDPLEVPTPAVVFHDLAQKVECYFPSPSYANTVGGLLIYVTNYDYTPLNNSELEVDHGNLIFRYPVTSVSTQDMPDGVARLNLTSDTSGNFDGLYAVIPNGTKMSLRSNGQIVLTGDIVDVATRPSTGLRLNESDDVYRVLQFEDYDDTTQGTGFHEVTFTVADPTVLSFYETVTTIASNVCTTDGTHGLDIGDVFIAQSTANGFTIGTSYYIISVPNYDQFTVSTTLGGSVHTLTNGTGLTIKGQVRHNLLQNFLLNFNNVGGTLPTGISEGQNYYVLEDGLTALNCRISTVLNGAPVEVTGAGSGTNRAATVGLAKTTLRENYNYVDLTLFKPGESVGSSGADPVVEGAFTTITSITIASPGVINLTGHGLSQGDCIRFKTTGTLPTGLSAQQHYFVFDATNPNSFTISTEYPTLAAAIEQDLTGTQSGTHSFAKVTGRAGDTSFAVVPAAPQERARIPGTKLVFKGEEYVIQSYESEEDLNTDYARVTLNRALVDPVVAYGGAVTLRSAVPRLTTGAEGNLTIRISLTRVTGHDLLDIGTGSYADTNYPNEIYGPPVNPINADTETDERDVGRVFYVTTDQYGNFRVGPYFRVDQGTGQVTFAAAIALSNLDGIGFKRGVPVAEFSTDSAFTDNAVDTVPTENAARIYIERRLGITHGGAIVTAGQLIPPISGGFMSLDGQLGMKGNMNLNSNKITNLADPSDPTDAVNLRSITFENIQQFNLTNLKANDLLVFTGDQSNAINAEVVGDVSLGIDSTANTIDVQINPGVILDADVNASAAIVQSKLLMNSTTTRANASGITQADKGLASFDSAQFTATDGWITISNNGVAKAKLAQITGKSVLGNNNLTAADASDILFTTVVDQGGSIKKSQYSATGFLRRTSGASSSLDTDYSVIDMAAGSSSSVEASKLIVRDTNGDFGGRIIDVQQMNVDGMEAIDSAALTGTSGYLRVHTYGGPGGSGSGGIYLQDGSSASDKTTYYDNNTHTFRPQNGIGNAPIIASSIQVTALTTGGNTTAGTITGRWTLTGTSPNESRLQATYSADVAEYYEGDKEYEVGTVLVFGGDKEVSTTDIKGDTRVAGVVSNTAAFVMYDACPGLKNLVALTGRVPCKVVGKIRKGDILVTSGIPGVAAASATPGVGTIVGKAVEDYDSDHIGKITVAVGRT